MPIDNFSPPPGTPAEQVIVTPLAPQQQQGLITDKLQVGNISGDAVQDATAGLISKTADSVAFDNRMTERKQKLDEAKFKLEERQAIHAMELETQRENFNEKQAQLDRDAAMGVNDEHWLKSYWRPGIAWVYIAICATDFIIAPMIALFMPIVSGKPYVAWVSLTLSNGGLFHAAMGGILGVSAYTRGMQLQNNNLPKLPGFK